MPLARSAGAFLVSSLLSIAATYHFLDLPLWARVIVDKHSFPRMKRSDRRFSVQDCLSVTASDQGQA
jgi:hypothetical protein